MSAFALLASFSSARLAIGSSFVQRPALAVRSARSAAAPARRSFFFSAAMAASDKLTDLLQKDHSFIKEDYNRWKASKNAEEKIRWANQFILDVSQHSVAEEIVYYPEIEKRQKGGSISKQKHLDEHQ
eukprot:tig00000863_g5012.t1